MLMYLTFLISISLLVVIILKLNNTHKIDNSMLFFILSNYLLNFSTSLFLFYYTNYEISLISSILLVIFSLLLLFDFKRVLKYIPLISLPYLFYNIYLTFYIIFKLI